MGADIVVLPELIEGERLTLRRWRVADAARVGAAVEESADHLRPWMPWMAQEPLTLTERELLHALREREWARGGDIMLTAYEGDSVVGCCGMKHTVGPGALEIGYWIHPAFTRRGLATEVASLLTEAAFRVPGIECVEIHHDRANRASAGVPSKLGFTLVAETPDQPAAPAEVGVECVWRMTRVAWSERAGSAERRDTIAGGGV